MARATAFASEPRPPSNAVAAVHRKMREHRHECAADRGMRNIARLDTRERDAMQRPDHRVELRGEGTRRALRVVPPSLPRQSRWDGH